MLLISTSLMTLWRLMKALMCHLTLKEWTSWVLVLRWAPCRPRLTLIARSIFRRGFRAKDLWDPRPEDLFLTILSLDSIDHLKLFLSKRIMTLRSTCGVSAVSWLSLFDAQILIRPTFAVTWTKESCSMDSLVIRSHLQLKTDLRKKSIL